MRNNVTTTDVAIRAGVSQATVSRVLNHSPGINTKTRENVLQALKDLGYNNVPKFTRNNIVALVMCPLPEQENPLSLEFFGGIITGIQEVLNEEGLELMLFTLKPNADELSITRSRLDSLAGLILLGDPTPALLKQIIDLKINCVQFDPRSANPGVQRDTVGPNKIAADIMAAEYLIGLGHKRIGVFMAERFADRLLGIQIAHQKHGLKLAEKDLHLLESTDNSAFVEAVRDYIAKGNRPGAIIVGFYNAALAVRSELEKQGIRVPEDMLLFTYGFSQKQNEFPMLFEDPRLYGIKAAQRILEKRRYPGDVPQHIVMDMELITNKK